MLKKLIIALFVYFFLTSLVYAGIEEARIYYLDKEYDRAIDETRGIIQSYSSKKDKEEAYFYLALSQMKLGYYKEARDNFRVIVEDYPEGEFLQRAYLAVADCFFLEGNYEKSAEIYKSFLEKYPRSDIANIVYFRLGQTNLKMGNWKVAQDYLKELKVKFPDSLEAKLAKDLLSRDEFFTVQVAAFINESSAKGLDSKLKSEGFDSYIAKADSDDGKSIYRVRVGKLTNRYDVESLQATLSLKGYPTRIYP
ncbi:MAG: tetratricopeptide repeat protein [Candidatus Omnitrophica bacterium]|nr:tetratricopeptide repeat protein [Candidatus Omnitrophota bacterium]